MGKASNRSAVEHLIERNRSQEARSNALAEAVAAQIRITNAARSDERVEAIRRRKAAEADTRELATELALTAEEQYMQQKIKGEELRERITASLEQQQQQQRTADLRRQLICAESEEIRKLKEQLRAAKVNRERAAQLLERQYREADAAVADAQFDLAMEEKRLAECEQAKRDALERNMQMRQNGIDLAAQIKERLRTKREQTADNYESEREQVRAVVSKLLDEMEAEKRKSLEQRQRHAQIFEEATRERERQKQQLLEQKIKEENEIKEYLRMQQQRADDVAREKELVRREKARVLNELLQSQLRKQQEQTDYAQLMADLYEYEREEQDRRKEQLQKEKRQKEKEALSAAFKAQMDEKERRRQLLLAEEGQFRQELFAKFAREARIEQMTQQRRKLAAMEHNRQVEAIIQERRRQMEEERQRDREEYLKALELEAQKQVIVQQERERLLRENAELAEFLPKYTIRDEREEQIVMNARQQQTRSFPLAAIQPLPRTIRSLPAEKSVEDNPNFVTVGNADLC